MSEDFAHQNFQALKSKSYDINFDLRNSHYKSIENIGQGAYGVVCSAEHVLTKEKVAIKKIPDIFEQPTIAKRTYREIKILKHFKHDNVIAIRDILKPPGDIENLRDVYIVLDLMETDMHRIIHSKQEITDEHVRYFLYQILRGLKYIHSANVIHRDLKPSNLLVNENCDVKIGDFGMARGISSDADKFNLMMTQYVATRWYRAPELLMARVAYTGAVDMWSVGCIFAEMLGRQQIFPGKNYIHQLELIVGIMGSPPPEFLQLTQSLTIKKFITGWGAKQAVPLDKLYPKAPPLAIDLLTQTLAISPDSRVSVEKALGHPFLKKYHDPSDEPCCVPVFDFNFEKKEMSPVELKSVITKEILDYHPVSDKPKIAFDFRPVPKSEIKQTVALNKKETSPDTKSHKSPDKEANFGLNTFLNQIRKSEKRNAVGQENKPLLPQQWVKGGGEREFSGSGQPLSFLSTNSPKSEFKVPVGLPISKQNIQVKPEGSDVEMLSAKSEMSVETDIKPELPDIEMLSANKLVQTGKQPLAPPGSQPTNKATEIKEEEEEKAVNAKEILKAAILKAALRKQKPDMSQKTNRPVTALQKQREREEKKRKKLEKAMERKKKQKEKEKGNKTISLSDEDKNLLQRWATMQNQPQKPATAATTTSTSAMSEIASVAVAKTAAVNSVLNDSIVVGSQTSLSQVPAVIREETLFDKHPQESHQESCRNQATKCFDLSNMCSDPIGREALSSSQVADMKTIGLNGLVPNFAFQDSHIAGTELVHHQKQVEEPCVSCNLPCKPTVDNKIITTSNSHMNLETQNMHDPFTSAETYSYSLPSMSQLDTRMNSGGNQTLDDILAQLTKEEDETNPSSRDQETQPPATMYSNALQASKVHPHISPPQAELQGNQKHSVHTKDVFLPFQTYQPLDEQNGLQSVFSPELDIKNASSSTTKIEDSHGAETTQMLSVITRQMMRSNMDDLTLTKTPKGSVGTGYGVGTDLESLMEAAAKDVHIDRSAPLSATESLIGDWLEVSGMKTWDSKEYEALERELGLESPINMHEIITSPT